RAYLALPARYNEYIETLRTSIEAVKACSIYPEGLEIEVVALPDAYIVGEETALLQALEGKTPKPRKKPPMPTRTGLFGAPTCTNNVETTLHAADIIRRGVAAFRALGTVEAPGTQVFDLQGEVVHPGLYELPLGTSLRSLIYEHGGGLRGDEATFKMVFPGGIASVPLAEAQLDVALEYAALQDAGSSMGSGQVVVLTQAHSAIDVADELSALFHEQSCGQCEPCKDGTQRVRLMIQRLPYLNEKGIDKQGTALPDTRRRTALKILDNPNSLAGLSYTDRTTGLDKIESFCEFFKVRGDCKHSLFAGSAVQGVVRLFRDEFEARMSQ
ncbi:MAG: NADH-ubiquinone oxidoreductase-F iron-sulfur binding region domain-containing protein, partial [Myxococcota bacterium]